MLKVLSGPFESPLVGRLETAFLAADKNIGSSPMSWDALSYAWEGQEPSEPLLLDSRCLKITMNVEAAVRHLRDPKVDKYIWIDSVCINQSDDTEKGNQVQQMHAIYHRATKVVIWLGLPDADSEPIFTAVDWLDKFLATGSLTAEVADRLLVTHFKRQHPEITWKNQFNSILGRSWFNRLWVVQEATLANQLEVRLGFKTISWESFASTAACFITNPDLSTVLVASADILFNRHGSKRVANSYHDGLSQLRIISHLRLWMRHSATQIAPSRLLHLCKQSKSYDARDKVYALQGLFSIKINPSQPHIPDLVSDYTITTNEVFNNFTRWCCQRERNLDVIAMKRNIPEERSLQEIAFSPSWATFSTDTRIFRSSMPRLLPVESDPLMGFENYHELRWAKLQGPKTLALRGFLLDTVADYFSVSLLEPESLREMAQRWFDIITAANLSKKERNILFGDEPLDIEHHERLFCATILSEWRSSHLWSDGHGSQDDTGDETEVNRLLEEVMSAENKSPEKSDSITQKLNRSLERSSNAFRSAITTQRGLLATSFRFVRPGDKICALYGGRGLFILRKNFLFGNQTDDDRRAYKGKEAYQLVCGDCYIHGFEDGQGIHKAKALGLIEEDICLV